MTAKSLLMADINALKRSLTTRLFNAEGIWVPKVPVFVGGMPMSPWENEENVRRYCDAVPGSKSVRGFLAAHDFGSIEAKFVPHTVVETDGGGLLDVTPYWGPKPNYPYSFLRFDGSDRLWREALDAGSLKVSLSHCGVVRKLASPDSPEEAIRINECAATYLQKHAAPADAPGSMSALIASLSIRAAVTDQVLPVPKVEMMTSGWSPEVALCHRNCIRFVMDNPEWSWVRGFMCWRAWGFGEAHLAHHSVLRDSDGQLVDITPPGNFERVWGAYHFIEFSGSAELWNEVLLANRLLVVPLSVTDGKIAEAA